LAGIELLKEVNGLTALLGGFSVAEDLQNNATVSTPINEGGMGFNAQWDDNTYYMVCIVHSGKRREKREERREKREEKREKREERREKNKTLRRPSFHHSLILSLPLSFSV
jgi:hypothetical protein